MVFKHLYLYVRYVETQLSRIVYGPPNKSVGELFCNENDKN